MPGPLFWDHQLKEGTGRNQSDERLGKRTSKNSRSLFIFTFA